MRRQSNSTILEYFFIFKQLFMFSRSNTINLILFKISQKYHLERQSLDTYYYILLQTPPPDSLLQSFPVPTVQGISFHALKAYTNIANYTTVSNTVYTLPQGAKINLTDLPIRMQLNDVDSNFVEVCIRKTLPLSSKKRHRKMSAQSTH